MRWSIGVAALLVLLPVGLAAQQQSDCAKGSSWSFAGGADGHVSAVILGMETFRGGRYCHARTTSSGQGSKQTMDYYFNPGGHDVWLVMTDASGHRQEMHLTQGADATPGSAQAPGATGSGAGTAGGAAPAAGGTDWCTAGSAWSMSGAGGPGGAGTFQARVEGLTHFKGGTYCKATYQMSQGGQNMKYTYYFTQDDKDLWMVIQTPDGHTQQMHISGGGN